MTDNEKAFDARATYDAAATDYEDASRDYWQYLSERTIDRLAVRPGESVLDVACGTGPATVAAARAVGPTGRVLGLDYAEQMLAIAAAKVESERLTQVELRAGDITSLDLEDAPFDAVVCVLGLFFFGDMVALLRTLRRWTQPDGRLGVTVLGTHFFDPMRDVFVDAVGAVRPDLEVAQPWKRTEDAEVLAALFADADVPVSIDTEDQPLALPSADDWWRIVMGTGLRRTIMSLDETEVADVRDRCAAYIRDHGVQEVVLQAHYAGPPARPSEPGC